MAVGLKGMPLRSGANLLPTLSPQNQPAQDQVNLTIGIIITVIIPATRESRFCKTIDLFATEGKNLCQKQT